MNKKLEHTNEGKELMARTVIQTYAMIIKHAESYPDKSLDIKDLELLQKMTFEHYKKKGLIK